MPKIKVSEASGVVLNWLVATYEHTTKHHKYGTPCINPKTKRVYETEGLRQIGVNFAPTTDWAQGGPIIERGEIGLKRNAPCSEGRQWEASPSITAKGAGGRWGYGPTPLIAAMRCYVASKLGDEVEVPEELL